MKNFLNNWIERDEYDEEDREPEETPHQRTATRNGTRGGGGNVLRLTGKQGSGISKRTPRTIEDASRAAEDLKERRPVIVNLEQADDETARRVIDFIAGVTYALNGFYERIADKAFLFTPSDFVIQDEDEVEPGAKGIYDESH